MMKKIILLVSIIIISSISVTVAEDTNGNSENITGIYIGNGNNNGTLVNTYDVYTSENKTLNGFCVNYTAHPPHLAGNNSTTFNISRNTSNTQNGVKELIVRYYGQEYENNNLSLQLAIWTITDPNNVTLDAIKEGEYNYLYDTVYNMLNSLTGLEIGDFYSYDNGTHTRNFTFYLATPNNNTIQDILLFDYIFDEIPAPTNNTTDPTNNTTDLPENTTEPTNNTTETTKDNSTNTTLVNNEKQPKQTITDPLAATKATMQNTGIPILALIMVLLSIIGFDYYRKQ